MTETACAGYWCDTWGAGRSGVETDVHFSLSGAEPEDRDGVSASVEDGP